jgi:hypothetical protein
VVARLAAATRSGRVCLSVRFWLVLGGGKAWPQLPSAMVR